MTTNPSLPVASIGPSRPGRGEAKAFAHHAAYLILLGAERSTPKALLFNADHHYLAEVFDDGFIVDNLRSAGTRCDKPGPISLIGVLPANTPIDEAQVVCFALGQRAV